MNFLFNDLRCIFESILIVLRKFSELNVEKNNRYSDRKNAQSMNKELYRFIAFIFFCKNSKQFLNFAPVFSQALYYKKTYEFFNSIQDFLGYKLHVPCKGNLPEPWR